MINLNLIKNWFIAISIAMSFGGVLLTTMAPETAYAADNCNSSFLGFPTWYKGLTNGDCSIKSPGSGDDLTKFIWHIVLNVVEIGLVAAGYIAFFFILYGGFRFLTSNGSSDVVAKARMMILNAIIGLVISMASVAIINLVIGIIG
ncbi:MAG: hypothetical protein PWQ10_434 [Patescibacteria group bacterium]|nr:hypothetical protein [Patescibacteria group bacterium]